MEEEMRKSSSDKKYITSTELRKHDKPDDLWISIQGKVYDVTKWAKDHPGGDIPLLHLAGQDVTDAFIAYHPGTAWKYLDKFFIGYYVSDNDVSEVSRDYRRLYFEFAKMGLFEKKGRVAFRSVVTVVVLLFLVVYGVLGFESMWVHLGSGGLLGMLWMQSAYMGHDSGHYQMMTSRGFNTLAQILTGNCLTGISIAWWKWTHNAHHLAVNSLDHDPDLQHIPVFAVSPKFFNSITSVFYGRKLEFDALSRLFISYQHWSYYPVMIFARINLYVQTFLLLFSKRKISYRCANILGTFVFWTWFPLLVSCLPTWTERVLFVLASFTVTSIQHIQFTLNHFSAQVYLGAPKGDDWFERQTSGTIDILCPKWMDWFHGGLQFQLEHHLFPRMPRCQLRNISPVVRDLCKKHNLPYVSLSFWDANVATIKTLRTAALQARDISNAPNNLLWEAVNTYG